MTEIEIVLKTLVYQPFIHFMWLLPWEYFMEY